MENLLSSSLPQAIVMDEILGEVSRYLEGFEVNEDTLAVDVIKKAGPGGNFFADKHTREHFLKEDYMPKLKDRRPRGDWVEKGSKTLPEVARERTKKILSEHREVVDKETRAKLDAIIKEYEGGRTS